MLQLATTADDEVYAPLVIRRERETNKKVIINMTTLA